MQIIADLQIHSRFSRAVSREMTIPNIARWAKTKGIGLMATGDWTHPMWFREIERDLEEAGNGLLRLRSENQKRASLANENLDASSVASSSSQLGQSLRASEAAQNFICSQHESISPYFLLATEVSSIYTQNGKGRRVHTLIWVPTLDSVRKISQEMTKRGCNLMSDGRPIIGLTSINIAELVLSIEPKALIIPAHAWTPWFSVFGAMSGFNNLNEAFGPYEKNIYAVETGLSSNPSMNWQIKELDNRSIVSFSDAHSGPKIGREATVFELESLSFDAIRKAIMEPVDIKGFQGEVTNRILYTIEFYPEEGKYHYTGHRACNVRWGPDETRAKGTVCPVCGKPLTQGVVQRVEELAGRTEADLKLTFENKPIIQGGPNVRLIKSDAFPNRKPFVMLVPLQEIIAECIGSPVLSTKTQAVYFQLTGHFGGEFDVLLAASKEKIASVAGERVALGIEKVRTGDIVVDPGYDGVFGVVKIWKEGEEKELVDKSKEQLCMF